MKKFIVASHAKMAKGIQSTLELFAGTDLDITYMSAYVDDEMEIEDQISLFFATVSDSDQIVIFTDMYGGSVHQKLVIASEGRKNVFIIAGFNLPVIVEVIYGAEVYTEKNITQLVENGRNALQLVVPVQLDDEKKQLELESEIEVVIENEDDEIDSPHFVVNLPQTMSTTLRVDERLIHGQIAMVWARELNLQGILVANDEVVKNETQQMALKMAVPSGIKVLIRSIDDAIEVLKDPRAQTKRLLVLVRTVADGLAIAKKVKNMNYINIGNVGKAVEGEKEILTQFVMLTPTEKSSLRELVQYYPETALQNVPADKKMIAKNIIE